MNTITALRACTVFGLTLAAMSSPAVAGGKEAPWDNARGYVYAQSAVGFELGETTVTLDKAALTLYFGGGQYGQISNADFIKLWSEGSDSFAAKPPYAVLRIADGGGEVVLGLGNPRVKGDKIAYDATIVSGAPPDRSAACALFIDPSRSAAAPASAGTTAINERDRKARETIALFKEKDAGLDKFFKSAAGWAVFPTIAKGGLIVGGARGDGVVYVKDEVIGYTTVSQGTIGLQIGGQAYSEIIFFEDEAALGHFKQGNAELSAQASAVAVTAGASADAGYADGVAIFTIAKGGAMLEASVGGQGFSFEPK